MLYYLVQQDTPRPLLHIFRHVVAQLGASINVPAIILVILHVELAQHGVQERTFHRIAAPCQHLVEVMEDQRVIFGIQGQVVLPLVNHRLDHLRAVLFHDGQAQDLVYLIGGRLGKGFLFKLGHRLPELLVGIVLQGAIELWENGKCKHREEQGKGYLLHHKAFYGVYWNYQVHWFGLLYGHLLFNNFKNDLFSVGNPSIFVILHPL